MIGFVYNPIESINWIYLDVNNLYDSFAHRKIKH